LHSGVQYVLLVVETHVAGSLAAIASADPAASLITASEEKVAQLVLAIGYSASNAQTAVATLH
jgi:hypothetical protein